MGQYFRAVNATKKEYVDPWDIGGVAKLWEWCANKWAGIFPYLLRKSNATGGGDIGSVKREVHIKSENPSPEGLMEVMQEAVAFEGSPVKESEYAGRWAGDEVYLVGDYDESGLFFKAEEEYRNISKGLGKEYNRFVGAAKLRLDLKD